MWLVASLCGCPKQLHSLSIITEPIHTEDTCVQQDNIVTDILGLPLYEALGTEALLSGNETICIHVGN